tara:strand:+ start:67703 stop:70291 length:2589 start_codon:yes stop_codon:yes gene_type:complete
MDFKRVYTSSKTYIILLTFALALILLIASMAYKQIMRMQESAEMVTHTLQVYNTISELSAHYTKAESEIFREQSQKKDRFDIVLKKYKSEGKTIIDSLKTLTEDSDTQQKRIKTLNVLLNTLYDQLYILSMDDFEENQNVQEIKQAQKEKINATLYQIRSIKNSMQFEEAYLMKQRKANYDSHKYLAPLTSLLLAFFALFISFASFLRIYNNKLRIIKSEAFLKSVLATTDNIVNYYEPIFDEDKKITDFNIVFANACNRDYLGLEPDAIMDKPLSDVPPLFKMNGEHKELLNCYMTQEKLNFNQQVEINGENMWFQVFATPLSDGILTTARNTTTEEHAKKEQWKLKKRLENQNLKLLDNRAFLANIFKSISHIILHFLSIRNKDGKIIDFEVLFANDRINPITGAIPEELKNKLASQVFPNMFESGVFQNLVNAIENNKPVEYEVPYEKDDVKKWFSSTAIKLGDGVTVTAREITLEKEKETQLLNLNDQLAVQNSILSDAERIAKIGSFSWNLDTEKIEISDNFYQILGYEVNAFEPYIEKYREFVHPEDLEIYDHRSKELLKNKNPQEFIYRIITKQGDIKHLKSNGQYIAKSGKKIMVGVVQDVTENIKNEAALLLKNRELIRSNTELESFNQVSSHDLQEPLRKIRLFISRIEDKDELSNSSNQYFNKIKHSVERMQSLIQNLLAYSRIDSSQENFEKVDLNDVLEKVKEDLTTRIIETDAKIVTNKLPKIKGLTFQIEQLFTNLISNALKYRNSNQTPIIHIEYEKINTSKIKMHFTKSSNHYHKISFIDNGIGFEPEYAEKIFEVFQRLHQKTEYSGTGIGLAICKKIVDTHNGYIHAIGKVNVGATFIIYLPA